MELLKWILGTNAPKRDTYGDNYKDLSKLNKLYHLSNAGFAEIKMDNARVRAKYEGKTDGDSLIKCKAEYAEIQERSDKLYEDTKRQILEISDKY